MAGVFSFKSRAGQTSDLQPKAINTFHPVAIHTNLQENQETGLLTKYCTMRAGSDEEVVSIKISQQLVQSCPNTQIFQPKLCVLLPQKLQCVFSTVIQIQSRPRDTKSGQQIAQSPRAASVMSLFDSLSEQKVGNLETAATLVSISAATVRVRQFQNFPTPGTFSCVTSIISHNKYSFTTRIIALLNASYNSISRALLSLVFSIRTTPF